MKSDKEQVETKSWWALVSRPSGLLSLRKSLMVVVRFLLLLWVVLFFGQRYMIYHPTRIVDPDTSARSVGMQVWRNTEGELMGYAHIPQSWDQREPLAVLVTHGNAGNALDRAGIAQELLNADPSKAMSVYIMEYPGYGAKDGSPSQEAFVDAVNKAVRAIPEDIRLVVLGESIGTGAACAAAAGNPDRISGLILVTPFNSLLSVAQSRMPIAPVFLLLRDKFPSDKWLEKFNGPISIIAAENDEIIPGWSTKKLYDGYLGMKRLTTIPDAGHNILLQIPVSEWTAALRFVAPKAE